MNTLSGVIVKGIGGFYYVNTEKGLIECRAKGIFRKKGVTPLVGDNALIEFDEKKGKGVVAEIFDRRNALIRPMVSNVSQIMIVTALESPRPNTYILDKLIASAEFADIKITLCFNKSDLSDDLKLPEIYKKAGFDVIVTSAAEKLNIEEIRKKLANEITVFAGNSGVGKSSLLNCILEESVFETGNISQKTERGRHTTRHSELVKLPFDGYIIDTPGFSSFELESVNPDELAGLFREFEQFGEGCRFLDCRHLTEPGCRVLEAVREGQISQSRHESYKMLFDEVKSAASRY